MPVAALLLPGGPHYARDVFHAGLKRIGFAVTGNAHPAPQERDLLVIWNRNGPNDIIAKNYERRGAKVIVVENGYIGTDENGHHLYAMALGHHNGAGTWVRGPDDRWDHIGIDLKPWREAGDSLWLLPQRGIGPEGVAMPLTWASEAFKRLRKVTKRPIKTREHPGRVKLDPIPHLADAYAAVTWGSSAAIKAIVAGIPVFYEFEQWIGGSAAKYGFSALKDPFLGDRLPMLRDLAWAQWSLREILFGEPFACLLG